MVLRGFDGNGRGVLFQAALRPRRSRGNIRFSSHSVQNCPTKMPASAEQPFWGQKTFCVVTGASQGIGRRFAIEFGRKFGEGSVLLLLARSAQGLQETRDRVIEANPGVSVVCTPVDLVKGNASLYQSFLLNALSETSSAPGDFQLAVIVHNAGSLGDIGPGVAEHNDADQWSEFLALNITSTAVLNSEFLKVLTSQVIPFTLLHNLVSAIEYNFCIFLQVFPGGAGPSRSVINITSLCAIKPIASMGQYCVGKAAREMFFQVLTFQICLMN